MTDPGWHDFVMSHFDSSELDPDGNPYVAGLRRVARILLGPITFSGVIDQRHRALSVPKRDESGLGITTALYSIRFLWCRPEDLANGSGAIEIEFRDVADVFYADKDYNNTPLEYALHASATAATKAEGRCLRKALQLQRVVSAEEKSEQSDDSPGVNGFITPTQLVLIDSVSRRCDINVIAYVNGGTKQYAAINEVPYGTAQKMVQHLSSLQHEQDKIPDKFRGYDPSWRK